MGAQGGFDYACELQWELSTPLEEEFPKSMEYRSNSHGVINFIISLADCYV